MTVRVAVIGAGWWGREHARVFSTLRGSKLCAVFSRTPEKAKKRATQFGATPYSDIGVMLAKESPDLVSVCLPNPSHFGPTLEVIEAGYPLLVEKPLVFDLDEADILVREANERRVFFAINFNHRYARAVELARTAVRDGRLGEMVFASWRFGGEGSSAHHPYANLIETQCHAFDLLEDLCGPIVSVATEMTNVGRPQGGYGTLVLALRFASGAVGSLVGTYDSSYAYPDSCRLELNGTAGRVVVDDTVRRFTFQSVGSETAEVWEPGYFNDRDRMFASTFDRHAAAVLAALAAGKPPPVHASAGQRALVLAHAAIESFEKGVRVEVHR